MAQTALAAAEAIQTNLLEKLPDRDAWVAREVFRDNRRREEDQAFGRSPQEAGFRGLWALANRAGCGINVEDKAVV